MSKKTETRQSTGHLNPFGLRMQPDLRERLEAAATESGRSLNAEIVARLEESFPIAMPESAALKEMLDLQLSLLQTKYLALSSGATYVQIPGDPAALADLVTKRQQQTHTYLTERNRLLKLFRDAEQVLKDRDEAKNRS